MYERIRELMGNTLDEKFAGTWSTMDMQDLAKFSERFAEMIVKECSKWIVDNAGAIENLGPKYFAQAMIKDFGVEE